MSLKLPDKNPVSEIKIVAFRAIDNVDWCQEFIKGHRKVLERFGITQITSNNEIWVNNPNAYVILAQSMDEKVLGGARVHIANDYQPLPIEEAVGDMDPGIHDIVEELKPQGVAEICGLWNSWRVAGMGIGSIYLVRACVALSEKIGVTKMLGLCDIKNVPNNSRVGYETLTKIGKDGTFYYPKSDLIAVSLIINDIDTLKYAKKEDKELIFDLRSRPRQKRGGEGRNGEYTIYYELIMRDGEF